MSDQDIKDAEFVDKIRKFFLSVWVFIAYFLDKLFTGALIFALILFALIVAGFSYQLYNDIAISASFDMIPMKK